MERASREYLKLRSAFPRATRGTSGEWLFAMLFGCIGIAGLAGAALAVEAVVGLRVVFIWATVGALSAGSWLIYKGTGKSTGKRK